jgi:hypothetical protein
LQAEQKGNSDDELGTIEQKRKEHCRWSEKIHSERDKIFLKLDSRPHGVYHFYIT